jgi:spermidine dehydrogenase
VSDGITRRDFLDGVAIGIGALVAGCGGAPAIPYPPMRTGMRGSHPGAFEVAHRLRDGTLALGDVTDTDERYDLIVVGAGISGLAAAEFFRQQRGGSVLVLDNHDDIGGHARRNEFLVGGHPLVSYGGTESIEYPEQYSKVARGLLADIGILLTSRTEIVRPKRLGPATFFDTETFGTDRLVTGEDDELADEFLARCPITAVVRADLVRLRSPIDHWPGTTSADAKARLAKLSYRSFLADVVKLSPGALAWFQTRTHSLYGVGIDAVPALDCWGLEFPGFAGMGLDADALSPGMGRTPRLEMTGGGDVQYADGNATVARRLVQRLVPLVGGERIAYEVLDHAGTPVRIRLSSTVVRVRERGDDVAVTYVRGDRAYAVSARACVLACWNGVIPYLVPELPAAQRTALAYGAKVPLVYTNVAVRDWRAFDRVGVGRIAIPGGYFTSARLELHSRTARPEMPAVVKLVRTPCKPGLASRDQHRAGRAELLATPFATFEHAVRDLLGRMLGIIDRDIAAITVNRWAHGYTYEYNSLWDPAWPPGQEPCAIGRQPFGRIAIANADAGAYAYTDGAIDQAWRAITEIVRRF